LTAIVTDLQTERLQREIDELRAQFNDLAHMVNQYVASLQTQIDDKVRSEVRLQP
jgi:tetrahydromethanopterin S-methyltransferase subunit B